MTSADSTISRGLSVLFVTTLLLCHGALGSLHLFSDLLTFSSAMEEHLAQLSPHEEHSGVSHGECAVRHCVSAEYFAVLLGVFLGAVYWLLRRNDRLSDGMSTPRLIERRSSALIFCCARGSTPLVLQVFRL